MVPRDTLIGEVGARQRWVLVFVRGLLFTMSLFLVGLGFSTTNALAQVTNGDFSSGGTGWTTSTTGNGAVTFTAGEMRVQGNDASTGNTIVTGNQTIAITDAGTLRFTLASYTSPDYGNFDYPIFRLNGTEFGISTGGALVGAGSGINNDTPSTNVLVRRNLVPGSYALQFGVRATDSCCGAGFANWDNVIFTELTQSPGAQTTDENVNLVFSSGNGNQIQVDTNTIAGTHSITISVTNGTLTLGGTGGLSGLSGNGTSSITFSGSPANINSALNGLIYAPTTNYDGPALITWSSTAGALSDTDTIPITVNNLPNYDFTVAKAASPTVFSTFPGTINYTITIDNTGDTELTGINVNDVVTYSGGTQTLTVSGPSGDADSDSELDVTETWTYTASYPVILADMNAGSNITNDVTVTFADPGSPTRAASASTSITQIPGISLGKTSNVASVSNAGDTIIYTLAVANTGNISANSMTVSDTLATPVCPTSGTAVIATLAPGAVENCTVTYAATQADFDTGGGGDNDIDNSASVSGTSPAGAVSSSDNHAVGLVISPSISMTKVADNTVNVPAGGLITYTYEVTNDGNVTIDNVDITDTDNASGTDPSPVGETLLTDNLPLGDSTDASSNNGVWSTLSPGDVVRFTATYTVTQTDLENLQ